MKISRVVDWIPLPFVLIPPASSPIHLATVLRIDSPLASRRLGLHPHRDRHLKMH